MSDKGLSVEGVVRAVAEGMAAYLGGGAIDYERVGAGAYWSFLDRLESASLRLVAAYSIWMRARARGLNDRQWMVLVAIIVEGRSVQEAAQVAQVGGGSARAARERTARMYQRGIRLLQKALSDGVGP